MVDLIRRYRTYISIRRTFGDYFIAAVVFGTLSWKTSDFLRIWRMVISVWIWEHTCAIGDIFITFSDSRIFLDLSVTFSCIIFRSFGKILTLLLNSTSNFTRLVSCSWLMFYFVNFWWRPSYNFSILWSWYLGLSESILDSYRRRRSSCDTSFARLFPRF